MRRWLAGALLLAVLLHGCAARPPRPREHASVPSAKSNSSEPSTRVQLQGRLMGFADRYMNRLSEATDLLEQRQPTAEVRLAAHATKYYPSVTVLALAADAEPEVALLDMLVVVTLERIVWEGAWAQEVFGEDAHILTKAQQDCEADIWALAASVMPPEQTRELRELIEEWRRKNPDRRYVSSTRFDDFAALRDQRPASTLNRGFLAPVDDAARAVDETRLFGERALFLLVRSPLIMQWQAELLAYELALKPEAQALLANSRDLALAAERHAAAADRFASAVQQFPDDLARHREALVKELEGQEGALRGLVAEAREGLKEADAVTGRVSQVAAQTKGIVEDGRALAEAVDKALGTADTLVARFQPGEGEAAAPVPPEGEPSRPFDILEYAQTAERLTAALHELNEAIANTDRMLASPSWDGWMAKFDELTERRVGHAGDEVREWIDHLFWRGAALVALTCVMIGALRMVRRGRAAVGG